MKTSLKKHADKLRFLIVGGANTGIDFVILFSLVAIGLPTIFANFCSTSVAMGFSFFANKKFTFKNNGANTTNQIIKFLGITLFGLWIIQPVIIESVKLISNNISINSYIILFIGKVIATCVTLVWNYLLYRKFVFTTPL